MPLEKAHQDWLKNDDLFIEQLLIGRDGELKIGRELQKRGVTVQVTPLEIRKDVNDRDEFKNQADMYAWKGDRKYRIEVKSLNYAFTGIGDFPFNNAIIVSANKWRNIVDAGNKPAAWVLVSRKSTGIVVVPGSSEPMWFKESIFDGVRKIRFDAMKVNKKHLRSFESLVQYLGGTT